MAAGIKPGLAPMSPVPSPSKTTRYTDEFGTLGDRSAGVTHAAAAFGEPDVLANMKGRFSEKFIQNYGTLLDFDKDGVVGNLPWERAAASMYRDLKSDGKLDGQYSRDPQEVISHIEKAAAADKALIEAYGREAKETFTKLMNDAAAEFDQHPALGNMTEQQKKNYKDLFDLNGDGKTGNTKQEKAVIMLYIKAYFQGDIREKIEAFKADMNQPAYGGDRQRVNDLRQNAESVFGRVTSSK